MALKKSQPAKPLAPLITIDYQDRIFFTYELMCNLVWSSFLTQDIVTCIIGAQVLTLQVIMLCIIKMSRLLHVCFKCCDLHSQIAVPSRPSVDDAMIADLPHYESLVKV